MYNQYKPKALCSELLWIVIKMCLITHLVCTDRYVHIHFYLPLSVPGWSSLESWDGEVGRREPWAAVEEEPAPPTNGRWEEDDDNDEGAEEMKSSPRELLWSSTSTTLRYKKKCFITNHRTSVCQITLRKNGNIVCMTCYDAPNRFCSNAVMWLIDSDRYSVSLTVSAPRVCKPVYVLSSCRRTNKRR